MNRTPLQTHSNLTLYYFSIRSATNVIQTIKLVFSFLKSFKVFDILQFKFYAFFQPFSEFIMGVALHRILRSTVVVNSQCRQVSKS